LGVAGEACAFCNKRSVRELCTTRVDVGLEQVVVLDVCVEGVKAG